jgi:hypothetical protein
VNHSSIWSATIWVAAEHVVRSDPSWCGNRAPLDTSCRRDGSAPAHTATTFARQRSYCTIVGSEIPRSSENFRTSLPGLATAPPAASIHVELSWQNKGSHSGELEWWQLCAKGMAHRDLTIARIRKSASEFGEGPPAIGPYHGPEPDCLIRSEDSLITRSQFPVMSRKILRELGGN